MIPVLIFARPLDLSTGNRVDIRIGSAADANALGLNGVRWEPLIARRPRIAQDTMSLDLDGRFKLAAADFVLALAGMKQVDTPANLYWNGAPVVIFRASELSWDRIIVEFAGIVSSSAYDLDSKRLTVNCSVDRTRIDKPLLTAEFAGTGGAEGEAALRGTFKPAGFGFVESREWVLFDPTNNIGMLDGYANLLSVQRAMEGLNDLGAPVGDYPDYATLKARILDKTVPRGRWATSIAAGMVGLGAPPAGRITFNATFGSNRTGAIIKRMLSVHAALAATEYDAAAFDALDASVNREVRVHYRDQVQISDVIEAMCVPLNATPLITVQNRIAVSRATASVPIAVLDRTAAKPRVTNWRAADPIDPTFKIVYRAERPGDVLDYSQVNFVDTIIDRGGYLAGETYRAGNLVWLADKSSWLYIGATPAAGNAPVAGSAYWSAQAPPVDAVNIKYASGETLDSLKPAQAGATLGAVWSGNLTGRPANLAALAGSEGVRNDYVSISAGGALSGAGGGQVTLGGIGFAGDTDAQRNSRIVISGGFLQGIGGDSRIVDNGYVGLDGLYLSNGYGRVGINTIVNSGISIGSNGALSGGGGGQVTLPGIGAGALASRNTVGGENLLTDSSFERGVIPTFAEQGDGGTTSREIISTGAVHGSKLLRIGSIGGHVSSMPDAVFFARSSTVTISFYAKDSGLDGPWGVGQYPNQPCMVQISLSTPSDPGTLLSGSAAARMVAGQGWTRYTGTIAGLTVGSAYRPAWLTDATYGTRKIDIDAIQIEHGDVLTDFGVRSSEAEWTSLTNPPANVFALAGTEPIKNALVSLGANGALAGGGGGQVTYSGIGGRALGILDNLDLSSGYAIGTLPVARAAAGLVNAGLSIGANGALSGGGGGQVTLGGIGFAGDTDAQRNARITISSGTIYGIGTADRIVDNSAITISGLYLGNGYGQVGSPIANSGISIGSNGALSGAGGGQVSFSGIGGKALGILDNLDLSSSYAVGLLPTGKATSGLINAGVSIAANGALSGGGGGQVTIPGLGGGSLAFKSAVGGENLMPDSSFERGVIPAFSDNSDGGNFTASIGVGTTPHGSRFLRLGGIGGHSFSHPATTFVAIGNTVALSFYVRDSQVNGPFGVGQYPDRPAFLQLGLCLNSNPSQFVGVGSISAQLAAGQDWTRYTAIVTGLTIGAAYRTIWFINATQGTRQIDVDAVKVEQGDVVTDYSVRSNEADWRVLSNPPANVYSLIGNEPILNSGLSIGSNGALSGGGGGQVTYSGIGGRALGILDSLDLGSSYAIGTLPVARANSGLINSGVSIGANGALSGGGGGQVTLGGIGFAGDTDAQRNSRITISGGYLQGIGTASRIVDNSYVTTSGLYLANGYGNGSTPIANSGVTIGSNGALSGGGGGQVTLPGIGAGSVAYANNIGARTMLGDPSFETGRPSITDRGDGGGVGLNYYTNVGDALHGTSFIRLTVIGGHAWAFTDMSFKATSAVMTLSVWYRSSGVDNSWNTANLPDNMTATLGLSLYNITDNVWSVGGTSSIPSIPNSTGLPTAWQRHSYTVTGLTVGKIYALQIFGNANPGRKMLDIDAIQAENGDIATDFQGQPTQQLQANGRAKDSRLLNTANTYGLRSLSAPPSYSSSADANSATVTLASDGVYYNDFGVTITLPSASFPGLSFQVRYYFWRNMPVDNSGDSYGYSTAVTDALGVNKSYIGYYTTPAANTTSGGGGGTTGGGGYYGGDECVWADAWVPTANRGVVRARDIVQGDLLYVLSVDLCRIVVTECRSNRIGINVGCTIYGGGGELSLSINTPMTLSEETWIIAANVWGRKVAHAAAIDQERPEWLAIENVRGIGDIEVAQIFCDDGTFAASNNPQGPFIFSHNLRPTVKP